MSKQSEAKLKQGYTPKATPKTCVNCKHFTMDSETQSNQWGQAWKVAAGADSLAESIPAARVAEANGGCGLRHCQNGTA